MNYLAHFYLSGEDPHWRVGGLMGDFLRGPVPEALPPGVRAGVMLHRRIDAYTDAHPVVGRSRRRVRPALRRFAGIVVDMSYDHFLASGRAGPGSPCRSMPMPSTGCCRRIGRTFPSPCNAASTT